MIIAFIGQPHSGKTTLAKKLQKKFFIEDGYSFPVIDGDEIRMIFKNKDFSPEGRMKNLNRISDIATFLEAKYGIVIVSAVYPLQEARDYFESINQRLIWVYLTYNEKRGRESFHVRGYEVPSKEAKNLITINTSENDIEACIQKVLSFCGEISKPA